MPRRTRDRIEGVEIPEDLAAATQARGWPEGLLGRALEAGIEPARIWGWLNWRAGDAADIERQIAWHQRLTTGDLRGREVTFGDHDAFCDLWANAPEEIGDFEVTTLRWPNGFAQFRLQERVTLQVIADGNVLVACVGWARRNVLVGGRHLAVSYMARRCACTRTTGAWASATPCARWRARCTPRCRWRRSTTTPAPGTSRSWAGGRSTAPASGRTSRSARARCPASRSPSRSSLRVRRRARGPACAPRAATTSRPASSS